MYNYDLSHPASPSMSYASSPGSLPIHLEDLALSDNDGFRLDGPGPSRHRSSSLNDSLYHNFGGRQSEDERHHHHPRSASVSSARFDHEFWNLNDSRFSSMPMHNMLASAPLTHDSPNLPTEERLFPPLAFDDSDLGSYGIMQSPMKYLDGPGVHHGNHSRSASWDSPGLGRPAPMGLIHDPHADGNFLTVPSAQQMGLQRRGAHRRAVSHNEEGSSRGRPRLRSLDDSTHHHAALAVALREWSCTTLPIRRQAHMHLQTSLQSCLLLLLLNLCV